VLPVGLSSADRNVPVSAELRHGKRLDVSARIGVSASLEQVPRNPERIAPPDVIPLRHLDTGDCHCQVCQAVRQQVCQVQLDERSLVDLVIRTQPIEPKAGFVRSIILSVQAVRYDGSSIKIVRPAWAPCLAENRIEWRLKRRLETIGDDVMNVGQVRIRVRAWDGSAGVVEGPCEWGRFGRSSQRQHDRRHRAQPQRSQFVPLNSGTLSAHGVQSLPQQPKRTDIRAQRISALCTCTTPQPRGSLACVSCLS